MAIYPVIPLRGLVVFPHTSITVDIGRKKSIAAYSNAKLNDNLAVFCAQKNLTVADPIDTDLNGVGTLCRILQRIDLPNNNVRLLIQGLSRVKIDNFLLNDHYIEADVSELQVLNADTITTEALFRQARDLLATLTINSAGKISKEVLAQLAEKSDANEFIDLLSHLIIYYDNKKQQILEIVDTEDRMRELCAILTNEIEIAKVNKKIANDVKESIDKGQKEFYLKQFRKSWVLMVMKLQK